MDNQIEKINEALVAKQMNEEFEQNNYISNKKSKRFDVLSKIKVSRALLFWTPIVQIIAAITFLMLLIVDATVGEKMGFEFTKLELAWSLSYVGVTILIIIICFMIPARILKKKSSFRITAISTLILSTLILSGSFVFWTIPVLLFFSLISLIVWICEVIAAIILILAVEELPNEKLMKIRKAQINKLNESIRQERLNTCKNHHITEDKGEKWVAISLILIGLCLIPAIIGIPMLICGIVKVSCSQK